MVYLQPFFQLVQPNPFSPSIISLPHTGHLPILSVPSGNSTLKFFSIAVSFLISSTASTVKAFIMDKKSSFLNLPFSISDKVFSSLPVYCKSKSSLTGNISTKVFPRSVQVKLLPFDLIYPVSFNFLMVSALVAGVPILNPLKIACIISGESSSSLKLFPHVSITLNRVFSL